MSTIHEQSPDIALGVNESSGMFKGLGAGDQGIMFGYACNQTDVLMPTPIYYAHKLMKKCSELRKQKTLHYLRPDSKAQVTVEYEGRKPKKIHTIVQRGGKLKPYQGVNKKGGGLSLSGITQKDKSDLKKSLLLEYDYVAVSFVKDDKDINDMVMCGLDVQSVIESNTYSGLEAKLKFTTWKKI